MKKILFTLALCSAFVSCIKKNDSDYTYSLEADGLFGGGCGEANMIIDSGNVSQPIAVPNVFTPNNDGLNDRFKPITYWPTSLQIEQFTIYDSNKVVQWKANENGQPDYWNGYFNNQLYQGVFYYSFYVQDTNNSLGYRMGKALCFCCNLHPYSVLKDLNQCRFEDMFDVTDGTTPYATKESFSCP